MLSLVSLLLGPHVSNALNTLIYGTGSLELRLLAAKFAARGENNYGAVYAGEDPRVVKQWRKLMYGQEYADGGVCAPNNARLLSSLDELGAGLSAADALLLVGDSEPLDDSTVELLFRNTAKLSRVVLISRMGVTRAKPPGPFGLGGDDAKLKDSEAAIRAASEKLGVDLSIVRVGTLKGGGCGDDGGNAAKEGNVAGLSASFYDTLGDTSTYMVACAYDKFTLGAKVSAGDPFDLSNPIVRAGRGGSFEPFDDETSRVCAAAAAVHALQHPKAVELTVSAAAARELPTEEEWAKLFAEVR